MNGVHDMGGMQGFGPIMRNDNEPVFKNECERRIFGVMMNVACNGHYAFDESRSRIEQMGHVAYLNTSYYERWLAGLETLVREKGLLTDAEIEQRVLQMRSEGAADNG
ncbi:hypothetical protein ACK6D9_03195 [Hoeflea sp. Naph1]|uniref:hypothetical protein n=1 Tax=Hoeflea sp. Naph1 TaxID=3388653 RepID=UPI0039900755